MVPRLMLERALRETALFKPFRCLAQLCFQERVTVVALTLVTVG